MKKRICMAVMFLAGMATSVKRKTRAKAFLAFIAFALIAAYPTFSQDGEITTDIIFATDEKLADGQDTDAERDFVVEIEWETLSEETAAIVETIAETEEMVLLEPVVDDASLFDLFFATDEEWATALDAAADVEFYMQTEWITSGEDAELEAVTEAEAEAFDEAIAMAEAEEVVQLEPVADDTPLFDLFLATDEEWAAALDAATDVEFYMQTEWITHVEEEDYFIIEEEIVAEAAEPDYVAEEVEAEYIAKEESEDVSDHEYLEEDPRIVELEEDAYEYRVYEIAVVYYVEEEDAPRRRRPFSISIGLGSNLGGHFTRYAIQAYGRGNHPEGAQLSADQNISQFEYGIFAFFDATFVTFSVIFQSGVGNFDEPIFIDGVHLPEMSRSGQGWQTVLSLSLLGRFPFRLSDRLTIFPLLGIDYHITLVYRRTDADGLIYDRDDGMREEDGDGNPFRLSDLNAFIIRLGGGVEFNVTERFFIRGDLLFGVRLMTRYERKNLSLMQGISHDSSPNLGGLSFGPSIRLSAGWRLYTRRQ